MGFRPRSSNFLTQVKTDSLKIVVDTIVIIYCTLISLLNVEARIKVKGVQKWQNQ